MARLPRLTVPGYPHHVIQRGNNRQMIFRDADDYKRLLDLLEQYAEREKVAIHSYVLMTNHFHFLATPKSLAGAPVQGFGGCQQGKLIGIQHVAGDGLFFPFGVLL